MAPIDQDTFVNPAANIFPMIYHASCFVCAVRRAGRLLESLSRNSACFGPSVAQVIRLEWRKKKAFFDSFIQPRNAIEHIDAEFRGKIQYALFNMHGDRLCVTNAKAVTIDGKSLANVREARDTVAEAILQAYPDPSLGLLEL